MGIFDTGVRGAQAYGSRGASELFRLGLPGDDTPTPDYTSSLNDYTKQRQAAQADASSFRNSIPGLNQSITAQQGETGRQGLAKKLTDIKNGANSRGLLYSGVKQSADAEAAGQTASTLSNQAYQTNQGLEQQAQGLENTAMDAGMKEQQMRQQMNDSAYQTALKRKQENQAGMSSLMGGAGSLIGAGMRSGG